MSLIKIIKSRFLLLFALPLVGLMASELALRVIGFNFPIPFLYEPLFEVSSDGKVAQTPNYLSHFYPYSYPFVIPQEPFLVENDGTKKRVILVGDSSMVGFPVQQYKDCLSDKIQRPVEVINMGFQGCGSQRAVHSLKEALSYSPDLILLYTGHSEFIDHCNLKTLQKDSRGLGPKSLWVLENVRLAKLMWKTLMTLIPNKKTLAIRMRRSYSEEDKLMMTKDFEQNFRDMIQLARQNGVKIVLSSAAHNYFAFSSHEYLQKIEDLDLKPLEFSAHLSHKDYVEGLKLVLDGNYSEAKLKLDLAFSAGATPDRITPSMNKVIKNLAQEHQVPFLDYKAAVDRSSPIGLPGHKLFKDNCHLTPEGDKITVREFCALSAKLLQNELAKAQHR